MKYQKKLLFVALASAISSGAFAQSVQVKQVEAQQQSIPSGSVSSTVSQISPGNGNEIAIQNINAKAPEPVEEESIWGTWSVTGMLRQEAAFKTTGQQNMMNEGGNPWNGVVYQNTSTFPLTFLVPPGPPGNGIPLPPAGPTAQQAIPTLTRPGSNASTQSMNLLSSQAILNLDGKINDSWSAHFKARYYRDELGLQGQNNGPNGPLNGSMQQTYGAGNNGGSLGIANGNNLYELPIAYVDYNNGPFSIRAGNQQIAWGEAIFFRVSDLANGLDLREQSVFGPAAEEFSNMRVSSPAVRAKYDFGSGNSFDTFVSRFSPTILPQQGSAYNPLPSQFIIDQSGYDNVKNSLNVGAKFQGNIPGADVGYQIFAVNRNNPDGIYKWTNSTNSGAIPGSAFSAGSVAGNNGLYNAGEWFQYASASGINGLGALSTALNNFSVGNSAGSPGYGIAKYCGAAGGVGGLSFNQASASCTLDTLFSGGNLNGWIQRQYLRESTFGGGLNKVFNGEPDSLMDQLIGRFEFNYTPQKSFTNPTLGDPIRQNDLNTALILEKYQKFSSSLPATYMVAQWMHKTASNIFGQSLQGMNNIPGQNPTGMAGGANYVALVFQQPSPSLEFRYDLTFLNDTRGGSLIQPGIKWKIDKTWQADLYGNIITSNGGNQTNFTQNLKYGNQVLTRISAYF